MADGTIDLVSTLGVLLLVADRIAWHAVQLHARSRRSERSDDGETSARGSGTSGRRPA
jgi:hypothetical protein